MQFHRELIEGPYDLWDLDADKKERTELMTCEEADRRNDEFRANGENKRWS